MDWRNVAPHPVVFVSGPEEYFASRAIRSLRDQLKKLDAALEIHEIEAADYQEAVARSLDHPHLEFGGTIEVRQLWSM